MKRAITVCLAVLLYALRVSAACTGSSPTWTSTPDLASVSSCVSSASRNDTINVLAGSATWASSLTLAKGVTLAGAGSGSTLITSNTTMIVGAPDATSIANSDSIKITGFSFNGNNTAGIFLHLQGESGITGTKPYRYYVIGNNIFKNQVAGTSNGVITAADANENGELRGVIYGNTFDRCDITIRAFSNNDTGEASNTAFNQYSASLGTEDNLYFENNTIHWSSSQGTSNPGWSETGQGGRLAMRYNTYDFTNDGAPGSELNDVHGFQGWPGGNTGTVITEKYGNTYTGVHQFRCLDFRGGIGMVFDNSFTGTGGCDMEVYGESATNFCPASISPTPTNYNPLVSAMYAFNNPQNGTNMAVVNGFGGAFACTISENNSGSVGSTGSTSQGGWWNFNAGCTTSACATGIGTGTTAPTGTCTKGTGFWAASTPGATVDPNVIQNAKFYQCSATNTWTLYYTPYTYPHPLSAYGGLVSVKGNVAISSVAVK